MIPDLKPYLNCKESGRSWHGQVPGQKHMQDQRKIAGAAGNRGRKPT